MTLNIIRRVSKFIGISTRTTQAPVIPCSTSKLISTSTNAPREQQRLIFLNIRRTISNIRSPQQCLSRTRESDTPLTYQIYSLPAFTTNAVASLTNDDPLIVARNKTYVIRPANRFNIPQIISQRSWLGARGIVQSSL